MKRRGVDSDQDLFRGEQIKGAERTRREFIAGNDKAFMYFGLGAPKGVPGVESRAVQRKRLLFALSGTAVGGRSQ
jgi:hypothetical protein